MQIYVYPYKCMCCRVTGKYYTGISPVGALDLHCPHDGSALTFQEPLDKKLFSHTEAPKLKTVDEEVIDALISLSRIQPLN